MNQRPSQMLAQRQQQLLLRSAELRVTLTHQARALQTPLAMADQVQAGVQWLRQHPIWPLVTLALLALKRPRRILRWGNRLMWGWGLYQRARSWLGSA
jgi:YqjK-like protein